MKKQLLFIFTLGTLSLFSQSIGTTFSDQGFNFRITSLSPKEVAVTGGGSGSSITIPETSTFNMESYTVVEVGEFAFDGDPFTQLTNVIFPNSIRTIGREAFSSNNLSEVILPISLLTLGEDAFSFNSLTKIILRSNISASRRGSFNFNALTSIISEILNPSNFPLTSSNITRSNIDLTIPSGTTQAYIDAGWTGFKSVTEASNPTLSLSEKISQESAIKLSLSDSKLVVENSKSNLIALELYDLSGALVFSTSEKTVDTTIFSKGVYILRMRFEGSTVVRKIVL